jgi:hypothetical protein
MTPIAYMFTAVVAASAPSNTSYACELALHVDTAADTVDCTTGRNSSADGGGTAKLELATTLTFADADAVWQPTVDHPDPGWIPEPGSELRTALETDIADGLHEIMDASLADAGVAGVQSVEIASVEQGRMDAHGQPVYYAFVDVVLTVDVHADEACISVDQLRHGNSCTESANAVADALKVASSTLEHALYEDEFTAKFTESGEDGFSSAEARAGDFELLVEGRRLSSRELRQAATAAAAAAPQQQQQQ